MLWVPGEKYASVGGGARVVGGEVLALGLKVMRGVGEFEDAEDDEGKIDVSTAVR